MCIKDLVRRIVGGHYDRLFSGGKILQDIILKHGSLQMQKIIHIGLLALNLIISGVYKLPE